MTQVTSSRIIDPIALPAAFSRKGGAAIGGGDVISAVLIEKGKHCDKLVGDDKQLIKLPPGSVKGEEGDRVYFEASIDGSAVRLKQIFPEPRNSFEKAYIKQLTTKQVSEMLSTGGAGTDETAEKARKAQDAERERIALIRMKNRAESAFSEGVSAAAELAAIGLDIEKLPIKMINEVVAELEPYLEPDMNTGINKDIKDGAPEALELSRALRLIRTDARLSGANIKAARALNPEPVELDVGVWEKIAPEARKRLEELGFAEDAGNEALAQAFAGSGVPLTGRNLEKMKLLIDGGASEATRRRQMAEIRLRWMDEAAARLDETGVKIDISQFREDVARLRELEEADNARALRQVGAPLTEENRAAMREAVSGLKLFPFINYATFEGLRQGAVSNTIRDTAASIIENYESSATVPSAKYGDSFKKISSQVAPLLEGLGIEANSANVRAANILIKNGVAMSIENLMIIRDIDAKVQTVSNRLHPLIAAKMIEEGLKPAELKFDDIIKYIDKFGGKYGENDCDRLAKYIARLDNEGDTTDWTRHRREIMNIYKTLYKAARDENAAVALIAEGGGELTLKHLAESADIYMSGRSHDFRRLEMKNLVDRAAPEALASLIEEKGLDTSIVEAADILAEKAADGTQNAELYSYAETVPASPALITALEEYGLPVNIKNLKAAAASSEKGAISRRVDALVGEGRRKALDSLDTTELEFMRLETVSASAEPSPQNEMAKLERLLQSLPPTYESDELLSLLRVQNAIESGTRTRKSVIKLNGRAQEVTVSVVNGADSANGYSVLLSVTTEYGAVNARIESKDGKVDVAAQCESEEGALMLKRLAPKLAGYLEAEGLTPGSFALDRELEDELIGR